MSLPPIGPGTPEALRPLLKSICDAIIDLRAPAEPKPVFAVAQTGLPPAASYPNCVVLVSDLDILAHSDGVHWIRQDTGAVIV
ncbi:MAG TPA: hypothetical protein VFN88_08485 [Caulobacteraceae bacterium]|uniref:hypothetical protein n=1 Tax=Phenylobacterium sp. TaxID=1871053 RepID=UPI00262E326A|nr:hypothetical protein [Phenylobacterium sp.]HET9160635.1 hypothetical protein [Caulobacteraceae bacterium]